MTRPLATRGGGAKGGASGAHRATLHISHCYVCDTHLTNCSYIFTNILLGPVMVVVALCVMVFSGSPRYCVPIMDGIIIIYNSILLIVLFLAYNCNPNRNISN